MAFEITLHSDGEASLFYSNTDKNSPIEKACVGHLRGDFGKGGNEFWTTWWEHQPALSSQAFKSELQEVIDGLRDSGDIKNFNSMSSYCYQHPEAHIKGQDSEAYGFRVAGKQFDYYLRLTVRHGDYNIYCYCYEHERLQQALFPQIEQPTQEIAHANAITEQSFEEVELFGKPALFTNERVDRSTVPKGVYAYDIRETEGFSGIACEIGRHVAVNHWGTVITRHSVKLTHDGFRRMTENDINYGTGDCCTVKEYMDKYPPIKVREKEHER